VRVYPFIEAEKTCRRNVSRACALLKVSRAAFYAWLSGPSPHDQQDAELAAEIQAVHAGSKGRYGAPRVHAELARRGRRHSRKRVARLMRQAGIQGKTAKRLRKTTIADPAAAARADAIRRDFTADASKLNSRWCGDITYIGTWEGWLYLSVTWNPSAEGPVGRRPSSPARIPT
jgi:transposase InsO family protein